ncbi:MAG TPA: dihydroxyacetone kinase phosphoryl donor subunit DhaM [Trebonia sp.]|jgi:PTS hybrid protein|nr:dihydroxyacetone kinase phosphoryl donor subunit DhaM [Trebonia sp.]
MAATVGIVLVSHSAALASGTAELAGQVGGGAVTIAAAGGTDDGRLGTSAAKVESAVRAASAGSGVVIVPDLGSSVLTVRALLADGDLDDVPGGIQLADAPFVEGAVAAVVTAAAGGSLKDVLDAAQEARNARKL